MNRSRPTNTILACLLLVVLAAPLLATGCSRAKSGLTAKAKLITASQAVMAEASGDYPALSRLVTEEAAAKVPEKRWTEVRKRYLASKVAPMEYGKRRVAATSLTLPWRRRSAVGGVVKEHSGTMIFTLKGESDTVAFVINSASGRRSAGSVQLKAEDDIWRLLSITINGTVLDYGPKGIKNRLGV